MKVKQLPHFDLNLRLRKRKDLSRKKAPVYEEYGKQAFIQRAHIQKVRNHFGRPKAIAKIFHGHKVTKDMDIKDLVWGDPPKKGDAKRNTQMWQSIIIQNICWLEGLAPRVYGLFTTKWKGDIVIGQLVEDAGKEFDDNQDELYNEVRKLGKEWEWENAYEDYSQFDSVGGKLVDFQTFQLNEKNFRDKIAEYYDTNAKWGKNCYQQVKDFVQTGPRKTWLREEDMRLDQVPFHGKTVLDVGCSGGEFCRYAVDHGAKRVVGVDNNEFGNVTKAANIMSWYLGYYNIDYVTGDFKDKSLEWVQEQTGFKKFDIVFYLSMLLHTGYPDWLKEIADFVIFEWNCWFRDQGIDKPEDIKKTEEIIGKDFEMKQVGKCRDHGGKPCYHMTPK